MDAFKLLKVEHNSYISLISPFSTFLFGLKMRCRKKKTYDLQFESAKWCFARNNAFNPHYSAIFIGVSATDYCLFHV